MDYKLEKLISGDLDYGLYKVKVEKGWLYIFKSYQSITMTFVSAITSDDLCIN